MSITIAICDDEQPQREYLQQIVIHWSQYTMQPVTTQLFTSAEAFQFAYMEDKSFDILLLDIQMNGQNGIELAKELRHSNEIMQIVFITGYSNYIALGYDVFALHYLMKPVSEQKLFEVLNRAITRLQTSRRSILFQTGHDRMRIYADDIHYVEAFSHSVNLYEENGNHSFHMRISDMELLLGEGFFRCHRSYIVGMKHVCKVTRVAMILDGGKEIPLSRTLYDNANQAFIQYN